MPNASPPPSTSCWNDAGLRAAIGGAARARMQRDHTWERVAERFETAYDLAAEHARAR